MKNKKNPEEKNIYDFVDIITLLQEKVNNEIHKQIKGCNAKERSIKNNVFMSKLFGNENVAALITILVLIFGLFGLSGTLLIKSYDVFYTLSLAKNAREVSSVLFFISSLASTCLGFGCVFNFTKIFESLASFYNSIIIKPLGKALEKSRGKINEKINQHHQKMSELKETSKSITKMQENFKYLIHSSLKDKLFTKKDVDYLYKHLTSDNIAALIHLLYHDGKKEIKRLSPEEQSKLTQNLEQRINIVKAHAEELIEKAKLENPPQRRRRMERFHTYPYDDKLTEEFSEFIPNPSHKRRS